MLQKLENRRVTELRARLDEAGSVFDFVVLSLDATASPGEAEHRDALRVLFEAIDERTQVWRRKLVEQHPRYANHPWPDLSPDLAQARPQALDSARIAELTRENGPLHRALVDPPYGTPLQAADFQEWRDVLRLYPDEGLQVLDWVGNADREPQRSTWSRYFNDGKEWWGIWCLTLYNPRRRTLSALAASATD